MQPTGSSAEARLKSDGSNTSVVVAFGGALPADISEEWERSWSTLREAMVEQQALQERLILKLATKLSQDAETSQRQKETSVKHRRSSEVRWPTDCEDDFIHRIVGGFENEKTDWEIDLDLMLSDAEDRDASVVRRCRRHALSLMLWFLALREPERKGPLVSCLRSHCWKMVVNLAILSNVVMMVINTNSSAEHIHEEGWELPGVARALELFFLIFFSIELLGRLAVHRLYFFCNKDFRWNLFDSFLVLQSAQDWLVDVFSASESQDTQLNILFFRTLRVLRMARTLRLIRVLRFATPLRRMLQSVLGSFVSLFWSFVMLAFVFFLFAIAIVQGTTSSISAETFDADAAELMEYFGSVPEAMLTLYMATSGGNDWSVYYDLFSKKAPVAAGLFVFVIAFTQIALLNVLTGLFVESAMKIAMPDDDARALEQRKAEMKDLKKFRHCLKALDIDCSGTITWEEFSKLSTDPRVHSTFAIMGLELTDAQLFFDMCKYQSQSAAVGFDFLLESCLRMRGPALSVDVQAIIYKLQCLGDRVDHLFKSQPHSSVPIFESPQASASAVLNSEPERIPYNKETEVSL